MFKKLVRLERFELSYPKVPASKTGVSAFHHRRNLAARTGVEPVSPARQAGVLPLYQRANNWRRLPESNRQNPDLQSSAFPFCQAAHNWCPDGESNPALRLEGPANLPLFDQDNFFSPVAGIEPATADLTGQRSTAELHRNSLQSNC